MLRLIVETIAGCLFALVVFLAHHFHSLLAGSVGRLALALDRSRRLLAWQPDRIEWHAFLDWAETRLPTRRSGFWVWLFTAIVAGWIVLQEWHDLTHTPRPRTVIVIQLVVVASCLFVAARWLDRVISERQRRPPHCELRASGMYVVAWSILIFSRVPWKEVRNWGSAELGIWFQIRFLKWQFHETSAARLRQYVYVPAYLRDQVKAIMEQYCPGKRLPTAPPELTEPAIVPSR